jgi:transcriptional regulator with XRE-family HTH domain
MSANVRGIEGEMRQFTPSEVGFVIKVCRKSMGLKREALALSARVTDKTIQRAEAGKRVREKSSRRIACALGLPPDTFTKQRFMPHPASPEEVQRRERLLNAAWAESYLPVTVHELRDVRDLIPLFGTGAIWVDDNNVAEVNRQQFAALSQVIAQANDQAAQDLLARIREVEARGYVIKGAVIEAYFSDRPFQPPSKRLTSYIVAFQKSPGLKDTTPVEGWFSKMRLLKLHGVADANQYPGDESTVWTGRDALGILCGDASAHHEAL